MGLAVGTMGPLGYFIRFLFIGDFAVPSLPVWQTGRVDRSCVTICGITWGWSEMVPSFITFGPACGRSFGTCLLFFCSALLGSVWWVCRYFLGCGVFSSLFLWPASAVYSDLLACCPPCFCLACQRCCGDRLFFSLASKG